MLACECTAYNESLFIPLEDFNERLQMYHIRLELTVKNRTLLHIIIIISLYTILLNVLVK